MTHSLPNPVQSAALAAPERLAVVCGDERLTWGALRDRVVERAGALAVAVRPGDVVPVAGPVSIDWVVELHALGWIGAVAAPMSSRSTRRETLQGLDTIAVTAAVRRELGARRAQDRVTGLQTAQNVSDLHEGDRRTGQPEDHADAGSGRWSEPRQPGADGLGPRQARQARPEERVWPLDETRVVVQTSGTTGPPRRVEISTAQLVFGAFGSATRLGLLPADRWLCVLPLHHVGGLMTLFRAAFQATCVELRDGFDAAWVGARLASGEVSHVSVVPTMLSRLLDACPALRVSPVLRAVLVGGAPTPPELVERALAAGLPLSLTWGMSESASQACTSWPGHTDMFPLPFVRVTAADDVLELTGPVVRGRHRTGDRGSVEAGAVRVHGRADDIIISGGENISPAEVESVLREHPAVADAAVVGFPDARWGMRPGAALVGRDDVARPELEEVRAFCRAALSGFKLPDRVVWCDALPRGELGKLSRDAVRAMLEDAQ